MICSTCTCRNSCIMRPGAPPTSCTNSSTTAGGVDLGRRRRALRKGQEMKCARLVECVAWVCMPSTTASGQPSAYFKGSMSNSPELQGLVHSGKGSVVVCGRVGGGRGQSRGGGGPPKIRSAPQRAPFSMRCRNAPVAPKHTLGWCVAHPSARSSPTRARRWPGSWGSLQMGMKQRSVELLVNNKTKRLAEAAL